MTTISAREAANRTRRAMALRDLMLEAGWDVAKITAEGQDGWEALARTIALRSGRPFRTPSQATQAQALELLKGALAGLSQPVCPNCGTKLDSIGGCVFARIGSCAGPKVPQPEPATAAPASAGAPSPRPESGSAGRTQAGVIGLNGRPRVPTNVTLMVD